MIQVWMGWGGNSIPAVCRVPIDPVMTVCVYMMLKRVSGCESENEKVINPLSFACRGRENVVHAYVCALRCWAQWLMDGEDNGRGQRAQVQ